MSAWSDRIRWGVIEDARGRERRWRWRAGFAVVLAAVVAGVVALALSGGGGRARFAVAEPGTATGSLRALAVSAYSFWVTPDLGAGDAKLDIRVNGPDAQWSMTGCCDGSLGRSSIIGISGSDFVPAPVPFDEIPDDVLLVSANVAAVRVGHLGTVGAVSVSGLQPGEKALAFRVPQYAAKGAPVRLGVGQAKSGGHHAVLRLRRPPPPRFAALTALDRNGYALPAVSAAAPVTEPSTVQGGACAVKSMLAGLTHQPPRVVVSLHPVPASARGIFLSCLNEIVTYQGSYPDPVNAQVALLVNAHHPGQRPAALWGATAVPGHPGIVELKPPPAFGFDIDTGAPMFARRVAHAWLVVAGRPAVPPAPTDAQRIQILEHFSVTRLRLNHV
jgi:hypothetical protein